jgi:hypothetical protein
MFVLKSYEEALLTVTSTLAIHVVVKAKLSIEKVTNSSS